MVSIPSFEVTPQDQAYIDELVGLLSSLDLPIRQQGIFRVMNKGVLERMAVETALEKLTETPNIQYYKAGSKPLGDANICYAELISLARQGKILTDIPHTSGSLKRSTRFCAVASWQMSCSEFLNRR